MDDLYLTVTRSTITPSARSSGEPRVSCGFQAGVTSFNSTGFPKEAASFARSPGITSSYGANVSPTRTVPSTRPWNDTVTSEGGAPPGRPPLFIQSVTVRLVGWTTLTATYEVACVQRNVRF